MNKKILIISHSYPPSNAPAAQRPYHMKQHLSKLGFECMVLCPENVFGKMGGSDWADKEEKNVIRTSYPKLAKKYIFNRDVQPKTTGSSNSSLIKASFIKKKLGGLSSRLQSELLFPDKALFWKSIAINHASKFCNEKTVLYSTSPSIVNHQICLKLKQKYKCKWVADFRDFYYNGNLQHSKLLRARFDQRLEQKIIKNADHLIFISEMMRNNYAEYYSEDSRKFSAIYNGFEEDDYEILDIAALSRTSITMFYAGNFYNGQRSPEPLLAAFDEILIKPRFEKLNVQIQIAGKMEAELVEVCKKYRSFRLIDFIGVVPRKEVLSKMQSSHLNWLIVSNAIHHCYGFPIKGYEYIGAKRPIICFAPKNSEAKKIITSLACGKILSNNLSRADLEDNIKAIEYYLMRFQKGEDLTPLEHNQNIINYKRKNQANQLLKIINGL